MSASGWVPRGAKFDRPGKRMNGHGKGHTNGKGHTGDPRGEIPGPTEDDRRHRPEIPSKPEVIRLELLYGQRAAEAPLHQDTVVQGLLHLGSLSLIYGKPKSGKSFLATNLALAVANEECDRWMDHKIKQHGPVLYVACEGHGGFWKRLKASGQVPDNFVLAIGRPKLIANPDLKGYCWVAHPDDVEFAIAQLHLHYNREPILVVIDTVFRSFGGGDVNKSADMNAYVASAQKIADRGIAVLLVHHANKGNNLPSGSIALMGGADTLIAVERDKDASERTWQIEEAKDGAETGPRLFRLEVVDDIPDAFGDTVTSCRVVDDGMKQPPEPKQKKAAKQKVEPEPEPEPAPRARTADQELMLRELTALFEAPGVPEPRPVTPDGEPVPTVTRDQLRKRLEEQGHITRSETTGQLDADSRKWLHTQLQRLHRRGDICVVTDWISLGEWRNDLKRTRNDNPLNVKRSTDIVDFSQHGTQENRITD